LLALQHFAITFGYTLVIGSQYNQFIYNATIPISKQDDLDSYAKDPLKLIKLADFGSSPDEKGLGEILECQV
jgi:hypothetical protein